MKIDYHHLGRTYFPSIDFAHLQDADKRCVEQEIMQDLQEALTGIKRLPAGAKWGVYLAYRYYTALFYKISQTPIKQLVNQRLRVPSYHKFCIAFRVGVRYLLDWL